MKRVEDLELRSADVEDSIEKVLYQQSRLLGKLTSRYKKEIAASEAALDAPPEIPATPYDPNNVTPPQGDLKAHLRQRAAMLRSR